VFKQVGVLSGGEKSRLALARMLLKSSNFLILDEPTNHLDMNSKQVLMTALHNYTGTILIISHDREFLDGIVTKVIEVKNKNVKTYLGNCSYYIQKLEEERAGLNLANQPKKLSAAETNGAPKQKKTKEQKRLEAEQRNKVYKFAKPLKESIHKLEKEIKVLEEVTGEIEKEMAKPDFFKDQHNSAQKTTEYKTAKDKLNNLYHKWSEESKKLTKIEEEIGA
jgi:ATP-binding cassette subfamily F protein 3